MILTDLITTALQDGMNLKRLLLVTGLDEATFEKYHRDELFNNEQVLAIRREVKEWRDVNI